MTSDIYVSIVIPTFNRVNYLLDALNTIRQQQCIYKKEILIMDNACDDSIEEIVNQLTSDTDVYYHPVAEQGLHNCRNLAIQKSRGEIVVFIDDDVLTPESWLEKLIKPFSESNIVMVGGKTKPQWETELPDWIQIIDPSYFSLLDYGPDSRLMTWPETPYGCNMAVRRDWALRLKGFSPDGIGDQLIEWKRGDGETGFAKKVYRDKGNIYYAAEAFLYHRIPSGRLKISYLYKRTVKSAISSFYSDMRDNNYSRKELIGKAGLNIRRAIVATLKSLIYFLQTNKSLPNRIIAINFFIKALYQIRLVFDSSLKRWVLQDTYM